jgi:tetratricopeptide (TPR) repeat protein
MGFWRREVISFALDRETQGSMEEQAAWIRREPANARPYYHLAQLVRMAGEQERALGLLLQAVKLDDGFAPAHAALCEIYAVRGDYAAAWRHARVAALHGESSGIELLGRHSVPEASTCAQPPSNP